MGAAADKKNNFQTWASQIQQHGLSGLHWLFSPHMHALIRAFGSAASCCGSCSACAAMLWCMLIQYYPTSAQSAALVRCRYPAEQTFVQSMPSFFVAEAGLFVLFTPFFKNE